VEQKEGKKAMRDAGAPGVHEKLTVNLVESASRALELAAEITGDTKTDTVNRAIQIYAYIVSEKQQGREIVIEEPDGSASIMKWE
jgi:hypothetical protein